VEWVSVGGIRGKGLVTLLSAPFTVLRALWQSIAAVRRQRPAVVVGLGGYVTGPGGLAAWLLRRPLVIHEQNAVAGFTNRVLARLARPVLEAFAGSFPAARRALVVGNPVRPAFFALPAAAVRYGARNGPLRLLVIGGSQGAARLNAAVPAALAMLPPGRWQVRHQAGVRGLENARRCYADAGVSASVEPFIDDIAAAYARSPSPRSQPPGWQRCSYRSLRRSMITRPAMPSIWWSAAPRPCCRSPNSRRSVWRRSSSGWVPIAGRYG
jgi:UDP-N-acetylglucosamine--N-acetylmuramyl-(pentapeptide) pyrophosphoryl-undecaprenol N-acetylglucosamine transferase